MVPIFYQISYGILKIKVDILKRKMGGSKIAGKIEEVGKYTFFWFNIAKYVIHLPKKSYNISTYENNGHLMKIRLNFRLLSIVTHY